MDKVMVSIDLPALLRLLEMAQQAHGDQGKLLADIARQLADLHQPPTAHEKFIAEQLNREIPDSVQHDDDGGPGKGHLP